MTNSEARKRAQEVVRRVGACPHEGPGYVPGSAFPIDQAKSELDRMTRVLMTAWETAEKARVGVTYVATFADMARAVLTDRPPQPEAAEGLREALDPRETPDMLRAMLLDAADRLDSPSHRGNAHSWPKHAAMFRRLADRMEANGRG